ncbi:MAG: ATP-binding cassette domain-containing protein [Desulfobacteraceae bacterium]|nr:ATP-binding cassette domain-containing protein [Desulfobacteraceae bacterium]
MNGQDSAILAGHNLRKQFRLTTATKKGGLLTALDDVSLELSGGETLGIAGESGCGKSTLGKILAGLMKPDRGGIRYRGVPLESLSSADYQQFRRSTQMIFQDPFSSLNPRMRISDIIAEPLVIAGVEGSSIRTSVARLMETVGLSPELAQRFPDEFSGGQRQRIGIARALAAAPSILIADEPVSSLDISIQAQIINLLQEMKGSFNLSLVMISHNLSVLQHMCDRICIMYLGIIVEQAPTADLFIQCLHPYTEALLAAIPSISVDSRKARVILNDDLPSPLDIPSGCRFHTRCRYAAEICSNEVPALMQIKPGHLSACHFATTIFPRPGE